VIHNGSYMKDVSTSISAATVMILCIVTGSICKCTIAKYSASASGYRGEILGAIITQIILGAAVAGKVGPYPTEDCNNNGVVLHGNSPYRPLSGTQTQANVLCVMKRLITRQPFIIKFLYVASHSNERIDWASCTIKERLNIKVDHLAKQALLHAHLCNEYFDGCFPAEDFRVYTSSCKVTGPTKPSIEMHWGRSEAKRFLDFKCIVHSFDFDTIWWHGMDLAMSSLPKMYRIFVSKQVSGWCGTNNKVSLWDSTIINSCPSCGMANKTSKHMTCCLQAGRFKLFCESMVVVITHLNHANVDPELVSIYDLYLKGQGSVPMVSCTPQYSRFLTLSQAHDLLGWDCLIEGRIPILLITTVRESLQEWNPCKSITQWGVCLIKLLLDITHKQWLYWNSDIHLRFDGLTSHQHSLLSEIIHKLIRTSPTDLLPCHRHLFQRDFYQLGSDSTLKRQLWVASMESAISAASHVSSGHHTPGSLQMFYTLPSRAHPWRSPFPIPPIRS
jgi:hypothetical protein